MSSRALVVKEKPGAAKRLGKTRDLIVKKSAHFGVDVADSIKGRIASGDIEGALADFRKGAFSSLMDLMAIAGEEYVNGRREHQAYVVNSLTTTARELAADLEALSARENLVKTVVMEILDPLFKAVLQDVMAEQVKIKAILSDKLDSTHVPYVSSEMDKSLRFLAEQFVGHRNRAKQTLEERVG